MCGLDDIWLVNGFTREETSYGSAVSIKNVEGLHEAIALHIISDTGMLKPRELRFLRLEMDLTQGELAQRLKVDAQTIARWEKGQSNIPGPVDIAVRFCFICELLPEEMRSEMLEKVHSILQRDEPSREVPSYFRASQDGSWKDMAA
jgi:DNA-binding transcriptional regulator YiaG